MKKTILTLSVFAGIIFATIYGYGQTTLDSLNAPGKWRDSLAAFERTPMQEMFGVEPGMKFGVLLGAGLNAHLAGFCQLSPEYVTCCPENYGLNLGFGYFGGALFDYPLSDNYGINLTAGYELVGMELTKDEPFPYSFEGQRKEGKIVHKLNADISAVTFAPTFRYNFTKNISARLGPQVALLFGNTFEQSEELEISDPYVFSNDSLTRNFHSGDIPDPATVLFGLSAGVGYEIPLNKTGTWLVEPGVQLSYNFNTFSSSLDWTQGAARLGIALKRSTKPTIDTLDYEGLRRSRFNDSLYIAQKLAKAENDSARARAKQIADSISSEIDENVLIVLFDRIAYPDIETGAEKAPERLVVSENSRRECVPLLNYVFFEDNSSDIPSRYATISSAERKNFDDAALIGEPTLDIYRNILNIIGKRMTENPDATITLTGCNSDVGAEKNNLELSRNRAEQVSYYLKNVWKIRPSRIIVEARNLPAQITSSIDNIGEEENRRVEIKSNNSEILKPLCEEFVSKDAFPEVFYTYHTIKSGAGVKDWYITAQDTYMDVDIFVQGDPGEPPPLMYEWDLRKNPDLIPEKQTEITFSITVSDNNGQEQSSLETLPVDYSAATPGTTRDTVTEVYSALMPFDDPKPSLIGEYSFEDARKSYEANKDNLISIEIMGYTDLLGTTQKNIELAEDRAKRAEEILELPSANLRIKAMSDKYDNTLPEGRFYNRSADVIIKYVR